MGKRSQVKVSIEPVAAIVVVVYGSGVVVAVLLFYSAALPLEFYFLCCSFCNRMRELTYNCSLLGK